jgi:hypothetical protein
LTQFGVWYWQAPVPQIATIVRSPPSAVILGADGVMLPANAQDRAAAAHNSSGTPPKVVITLPDSKVLLNGDASYSPAGNISSVNWTIIEAPATALTANTSTLETLGSRVLRAPHNLSSSAWGLCAGTWTFQLAVADNYGAIRNATQTVLVNRAPWPTASRVYYAPSSLGLNPLIQPDPVPGTESSTAYMSALAAASPSDVAVDATASTDPDSATTPLTVLWTWRPDLTPRVVNQVGDTDFIITFR